MTTEIVGYTYQADSLCVECARVLGIAQARLNGSAMSWGDCGTAEQTLGEWASLIGVDRMDERSYDSGFFPKVIFPYHLEGCEICGHCFTCIAHDFDECPRERNTDEDDA